MMKKLALSLTLLLVCAIPAAAQQVRVKGIEPRFATNR